MPSSEPCSSLLEKPSKHYSIVGPSLIPSANPSEIPSSEPCSSPSEKPGLIQATGHK
jgi:hypothetical protein